MSTEGMKPMPDVRPDPYHLNYLAEESRQLLLQIQDQMLALGVRGNLSPEEYPYVVVTRDLESDLHYGITTNVKGAKLRAMLQEFRPRTREGFPEKADILTIFRDLFIESFEKGGLLYATCEALKELRFANGQFALHEIELQGGENAKIESLVRRSNGEIDDRSTDFKSSLDLSGYKIGDALRGALIVFGSMTTKEDAAYLRYLIAVRLPIAAYTLTAKRRRSPRLVQMILFRCKESERGEEALLCPQLTSLMDMSHFSALSVLYEKERYFARAVRQSAQGTIIKWGYATEIEEQIKRLDDAKIVTNPAHAAPLLLAKGSGGENTRKIAWYEMPRYKMPRLVDLLATTSDFSKFEVVSLARSCYDHLKVHFWGGVKHGGHLDCTNGIDREIMTCLLIAQEACGSARTDMTRIWTQSLSSPVVTAGDRVVAVDPISLAALGELVKLILESQDLRVTIQHSEAAASRHLSVFQSPQFALQTLVAAWIPRLSTSSDIVTPHLQCGSVSQFPLHGDPHFENLFVDASVPEDPFVVAIDPEEATYKETVWEEILNSSAQSVLKQSASIRSEIKLRFLNTERNPSHDVAKLLLSATGLYGLVMKKAFHVSVKDNRIELLWQPSVVSEPLNAGGISGAKMIQRSAAVASEAMLHHQIFATKIFQLYSSDVESMLVVMGASDNHRVRLKNVCLVRLWSLLVRHIFKIAGAIFPNRGEEALILYTFGCIIVSGGVELIARNVNADFECEKFARDIEGILTSPFSTESVPVASQ